MTKGGKDGPGEMAHLVFKALAAISNDLSSTPSTHKVEREKQLSQVVLWPSPVACLSSIHKKMNIIEKN